jgi:hypothetical protein
LCQEPENGTGTRTQDFGENENKNHADEETGLLSGSSDTSITDNTNSETSSKTSETDGKTSTELNEAGVEREILLQTIGDKDRDDETVDTNDTGHNDGDNVWTSQRLMKLYARDENGLLLTMRSGRRTPIAAMPTPDLAVP